MSTPQSIPDAFWPLLDAACAGELSEQQRAELEGYLEGNPAARRAFLDHIGLCTQIRLWQKGQRSLEAGLAEIGVAEGSGFRGQGFESEIRDSGFGVCEPECPESPAPSPEPPIPPIVIRVSPPVAAPLSALFAPGGWAFSYAAAMAITGVLLLVLWGWKVSREDELAQAPPPQVPPLQQHIELKAELVGHVSGTADCRWAEPPAAEVRLGGKYVLDSGLAEISYQSGAKVILEGPCAYEVDSPAGGFLAIGKLTARVASGQWSVASEERSGVRGQRSEHYPLATSHQPLATPSNPQSPVPNPLFVVRTPTAVVTDLGTEFGVEVAKEGTTTSHVFRGSVRISVVAPGAGPQEIVLRQDESARAERAGSGGGPRLARYKASGISASFKRRLVEPPRQLDLLDIVAGGDGTGHRRERGIDPTTGMQDPAFMADERGGDRQYRPVPYNKLIDGVFVPDGGPGPVRLDSAGHQFDGFPQTTGDTFGSIWARAAEIKRDERAESPYYWVYAMGRGGQFMPEGRGLLGLHANTGITFDLEAMRQTHPGVRPARFRGFAGVVDTQGKFPTAAYHGQAAVWVFVDGNLRLKRLQLRPEEAAIKVDVEIGPRDRFLTLVSTSGGGGKERAWVVFGDPVLEMTPQQ